MRTFLLILITAVCLGTTQTGRAGSATGEPNYCHDKESWKEWDALVEKYPESADIQMLHAVRIGLCKKIEAGTISFEKARDVFNHMHKTAVKRAEQRQQNELENRQL